MSLAARWKEQWAERRAEWNRKVQAGATMHGPVRSLTRDEIAAIYGAAPKPEPVAFVPPKVAAPRPPRKVIQVAIAPKPRPRGFQRKDDGVRAQIIAVLGDRSMTVEQIRAALPSVNPRTIRAQLRASSVLGELVRVGWASYARPGVSLDGIPACHVAPKDGSARARILRALDGGASLTFREMREGLGGSPNTIKRAMRDCLERGELVATRVNGRRLAYRRAK